jgi:hypothetical protein
VSANPVLLLSLKYGAVIAAVVAVLAGVIGFLVSGGPGVAGALIGTALSAVFLGLTAVSMLIAGRVSKGDPLHPGYFGVVIGAMPVKLILFVVLALWLRGQDWLDLRVLAVAAIVNVLGSLIADVVAFSRARVPYVSDVTLPGEGPAKP